ncbi:hypothetical protein ACMHYP_23155 [Bacillus cereus]|nr:hypothetical protein [Bacillus sp. AR18-7]
MGKNIAIILMIIFVFVLFSIDEKGSTKDPWEMAPSKKNITPVRYL